MAEKLEESMTFSIYAHADRRMKAVAVWTIWGISCAICRDSVASAAITPDDEYNKRIHAAETVAPLGSSAFGESVNLYNGSTEFSTVDIDLPGNGLPVQLRRRYRVEARRSDEPIGNLGGFGDWSLDVPYIDGVFAASKGWKVISSNGYDRCSAPAWPDTGGTSPAEYTALVWNGYRINLPNTASQELLVDKGRLPQKSDGKVYPWLTMNLVRIGCGATTKNGYPGESFVAITPTGIKYTFDWVVTRQHSTIVAPVPVGVGVPVDRVWIYMMATRVEDRFGNWVNYQYSGDKLARIEANDGRFIALTWSGDRIVTATASSGQWGYGYRAAPAGYYPTMELSAVTLPDQSQWTYAAVGTRQRSKVIHDDDPVRHCQIDKVRESGGVYDYVVKAPSGATADFRFDYLQHWRNYIPLRCPFKADDGPPAYNPTIYNQPGVYAGFYEWSLTSKTISGPALASTQWSYQYGEPLGNYYAASAPYQQNQETYIPPGICSDCSVSKSTFVAGPNAVTEYVYGAQYARNEGRLLAALTRAPSGVLLRSKTNTFLDEGSASTQAFFGNIGSSLLTGWDNPTSMRIRPIVASAIIQDGRIFQSEVLQAAGVYDFDIFARATRELKSSKDYVAPHPPTSVPQIIAPGSSDTGSYTVAWNLVAEVTRYVLEESANGGSWAQVGGGDVANATFSGKDSGAYSYRVKACNDIGCSALSGIATVNVSLTVPLTPTLTMPSDWDRISVLIAWTPVSSVRYELMQSSDSLQSWVLKYSGPNLQYALQQPNHTGYFYKVRACNSQACGAYSTIHEVFVDHEGSKL